MNSLQWHWNHKAGLEYESGLAAWSAPLMQRQHACGGCGNGEARTPMRGIASGFSYGFSQVPTLGSGHVDDALPPTRSTSSPWRGSGTGPGALAAGLPRVTVGNFRATTGQAFSPDNHCPVCPRLPGLGLNPHAGDNFMEVRGDIAGHRPGVQYDFKRSKERVVWMRVGEQWSPLDYKPTGSPDDWFDTDEDLTPQNNRIYAVDGPGFRRPQAPVPNRAAEEAVYKGNYVEWVNARSGTGGWTKVSNELNWHSVSWLEKVSGRWRRKPGWNEIDTGHIFIGRALPYGLGDFPLPREGGSRVV